MPSMPCMHLYATILSILPKVCTGCKVSYEGVCTRLDSGPKGVGYNAGMASVCTCYVYMYVYSP